MKHIVQLFVFIINIFFQEDSVTFPSAFIILLYFFSNLISKKFSTYLQIRSVTQLCPTLCDLMNRSTPVLPVHHQLPEFTETHIHWVSDAIQPSHPQQYHTIFFLLLTPFSMTISRSIHVGANDIISSCYGLVILRCIYVLHFLYPLFCRCTFRLLPYRINK